MVNKSTVEKIVLFALILLLLVIKLPLALTNEYAMEDQTRMGAVAIAIREYGLAQGARLTTGSHGSLLLESIFFTSLFLLKEYFLIYQFFPLFIQILIIIVAYSFFLRYESLSFATIFCLLLIFGPRLFSVTVSMYGSQQEAFLLSLVIIYLMFKTLGSRSIVKHCFLFFLSGLYMFFEPTLLIITIIVLLYLIYINRLFLYPLKLCMFFLFYLLGLLPRLYFSRFWQEHFLTMSLKHLSLLVTHPKVLIEELRFVLLKNLFLFDYGFGRIFMYATFAIALILITISGFKKQGENKEPNLFWFFLFFTFIFLLSYLIALDFDRYNPFDKPFGNRNLIYLYLPYFYFIARAFFTFKIKSKLSYKLFALLLILIFISQGVVNSINSLSLYRTPPRIRYSQALNSFLTVVKRLGISTLYSDTHAKWSGYFITNGNFLFACGFDLFNNCPWGGTEPFFEKQAAKEDNYSVLFVVSHGVRKEKTRYNEMKFREILKNNSIYYNNLNYSFGPHHFNLYYNFSKDIRRLGFKWNLNKYAPFVG